MVVLAMASTVRQVKRHSGRPKNVNANRHHVLIGSVAPGEVEVGGPYKPVPPPKPAPPPPHAASAYSPPPPYRMPPYPLYGEPPIPGAAPPPEQHSPFHPHQHSSQTTPLHTHSSKFPIEREVILSSADKNSKIPILNEYRKRAAAGAVAPDAPHVQLAWQDHNRGMDQIQPYPQDSVGAHQLYKAHPMTLLDSSRGSEPSPINGYASASTGAVPRSPAAHSTPEGVGAEGGDQRPFPARTYHTIKDIISSKFQRRSDKVEQLSPQSQLRQHGVYLASTAGPSSAEITRRNREIQQQLIKERTHDGGFQETGDSRNYGTVIHHTIEMETPRGRPQVAPLHNPTQLRSGDQSSRQVEPLYGRAPAGNWYRDTGGGYGVPGNRHSIIDTDSTRKVDEGRKEERRQLEARNARTPEAGRRTEVGRTVAQRSRSVERLDCGGDRTDDDDGGFKLRPLSGVGAGGGGGQSDSGRGSTVYSSGKAKTDRNVDTSPEPPDHTPLHLSLPGGGGESSQWVDMVESELRHILEPKSPHHLNMASSTLSESISSMTPPLPPLSPGPPSSDDCPGPAQLHHKHKTPLAKSRVNVRIPRSGKDKSGGHRGERDRDRSTALKAGAKLTSGSLLFSSQDLELDSMLDDEGDNSSDDEESTTVDIRRQLEGLENMYSEVLKLLGVGGAQRGRYQPPDSRTHTRRRPTAHGGSLSSLPSSVSSRPTARRTHTQDRRKNKVKDIKGINKRFQRLESHVVTLARSVAHLSSEMRTQHLMIQEMEVIRGELAALRTQSNMAAARQMPPHLHHSQQRASAEQANSQPERVRKLTKFFGDEPPLLRLFLKKLGYEKYAALFEAERVGLVELPYLTEERLHRLGVPLGPRLRIMQEAQIGIGLPLALHDNTLCIV